MLDAHVRRDSGFRGQPWTRMLGGWLLALAAMPAAAFGAAASVDLGATDVAAGLANVQRGNNSDGENDPLSCGPAGRIRGARRNRGSADDDFPDAYFYFLVTDPAVKGERRLRVGATFYDDPAFAGDPVTVRLHYTNEASTGPGDIPNTFAGHPKAWALSGGGQWVRHTWRIDDAGFRTFMQGTADFRFDVGSRRVCVDRVDVAADPPATPDEHLIGAHYYPWYNAGRWDYGECYAGTLRLELAPAQQPKLGRYDSSNTAVVDQHLRWCAEYGVNVLLLEFIAPGGREDRICRETILPHARSADVRFAVMYDWAIRSGDQFTLTPELVERARGDFDHLAREYLRHPRYLRIAGDRPLVMIYVTRALRGDVDGLIGTLRDACAERDLDVFIAGDEFFFPSAPNRGTIERWDGIFGYDVYAGRGGYWETTGTLDLFRERTAAYRSVARDAGVVFFPSCAPGFNDRAVRRTCADNPAFARVAAAGGGPTSLFQETFVETALGHVDAEIPLVSITSFNEWHEDTQIEPTAGTAAPTSSDTSPSGQQYTQGFPYHDYGTAHLAMIRDATIAVTGRVRGPAGLLAGAAVEVLDEATPVLERRSFTTGIYAIPRLGLRVGAAYRLRASAPGLGEVVSAPFTVQANATITGFDLTIPVEELFRRGDANADAAIDIADAVCVLGYLFGGAADPCAARVPRCLDAADANDDGAVDIGDAVKILGHLFGGGGPLPPPGGACGVDPVDDSLPPCEDANCP